MFEPALLPVLKGKLPCRHDTRVTGLQTRPEVRMARVCRGCEGACPALLYDVLGLATAVDDTYATRPATGIIARTNACAVRDAMCDTASPNPEVLGFGKQSKVAKLCALNGSMPLRWAPPLAWSERDFSYRDRRDVRRAATEIVMPSTAQNSQDFRHSALRTNLIRCENYGQASEKTNPESRGASPRAL